MTFTLAAGLVMAMVVARMALPPALRVLSRHASPELYQLTLIAFCLLCGWLSGFMVRDRASPSHRRSCMCWSRRSSCPSSCSVHSACSLAGRIIIWCAAGQCGVARPMFEVSGLVLQFRPFD